MNTCVHTRIRVKMYVHSQLPDLLDPLQNENAGPFLQKLKEKILLMLITTKLSISSESSLSRCSWYFLLTIYCLE